MGAPCTGTNRACDDVPVDVDNGAEMLARAVDSDDVATVLEMQSPAEIAEAWWRSNRSGRLGEADDADWWAVVFVFGCWRWPDVAEPVILNLVRLARDEAELAFVGAGPIEDYIVAEERRVSWLERNATESERFKDALRNVYSHSIEEQWVVDRLAAVLGD
jgi:hypothetical protein